MDSMPRNFLISDESLSKQKLSSGWMLEKFRIESEPEQLFSAAAKTTRSKIYRLASPINSSGLFRISLFANRF